MNSERMECLKSALETLRLARLVVEDVRLIEERIHAALVRGAPGQAEGSLDLAGAAYSIAHAETNIAGYIARRESVVASVTPQSKKE